MGFWSGMSKMIQGKPVFENDASTQHAELSEHEVHMAEDAQADGRTPVGSNGQKIIPECFLEHADNNLSGDNLEVWLVFHNKSDTPIFLDKIMLLGITTEIDFELAPGGSRKARVYKGKTLHTNSYTHADVMYRSSLSGDYFQARYTVEYDYEADGTYLPEEFKLQHPIRDI